MASDVAADSGKNVELYVKIGGEGVCGDLYTPDSVYGTWSNFISGTEATLALAAYGAGRISVKANGAEFYVPILAYT